MRRSGDEVDEAADISGRREPHRLIASSPDRLVEKESTGSTNDDARELALAGAPTGAAVLARAQARGRGRAGRAFASPPGGLYLSVVVRPRFPIAETSLLPLAAGVVAVEALRARGYAAGLKWPNDILLGAEKVGGILVESRWDATPFAIVGTGINLEAPPPSVEGSTALALHGAAPDVRALAVDLRDRLVAVVEDWDPARVVDAARAVCVTLGREVEWDEKEGRAVDIAEDGALVVQLAGGARERVVAGDVRLRVRGR